MSNIRGNVNDTARECSQKYTNSKLTYEELSKCASSLLGNSLLHASGSRTSTLVPIRLNYVPWLNVNNKHDVGMQQEAESNLAKLICDQYTVRKRNFFRSLKFS